MLLQLSPMICPACGAGNDETAGRCLHCGAFLAVSLKHGSIVASRYEILSTLGSGGMGRVYKAHDRVLDERVALKVLRPEFARDADMARRFQSEIKLARKVTHKNVCRIHEYGQEGSLRYLSMEFVSGTDLKQVLRVQGGLLAEGAFEVALEIAAGLQAIHEVGIIHRDLKTLNIMLDSRGIVRLLDFGIAKEWGTLATGTGLVVGTPEYMSPEQAQGNTLDFRSDIYALGIVVFEIFTGRVPFQGDTAVATLYKHVNDPPPFESAEAEGMPKALIAVLRKALAKDPSDRYSSAGEMATALRRVQSTLFDSSAGTAHDPGLAVTRPAGLAVVTHDPSPILPNGSAQLLGAIDEMFGSPAGGGHVIPFLNVLIRSAKEMSRATAGRVVIFGGTGSADRIIEACVGDGSDDLNGLWLGPGEGLAARASETGECFLLHSASEHASYSPRCDNLPGGPGFLCVPLRHRALRGAILLAGRAPDGFGREDQDLLLRLARCAAVAIENATLEDRSIEAFTHTSEILVSFLERVDPLYAGHSREVAALTQLLGERLSLTELEQRQVYFAAFLHDVGKFRLDPALLTAERELSEAERRVLQEHVVLGVQLLAPITPWEEVLRIVHAHHERWDGSGYPRGLIMEEIPLGARIVAVADVFDAMVSRAAPRSAPQALADLEALAGNQLDPRIVRLFVSEYRERANRLRTTLSQTQRGPEAG